MKKADQGHDHDARSNGSGGLSGAQAPMQIVVMGVSGAGKSDVGAVLAKRLGAMFTDADSLHPQSNVEKMTGGFPLSDEDRLPWLELVGEELANTSPDGIVVACSALKRAYRDTIRTVAPGTQFILLDIELAELQARLASRADHFMPASLLASQLETLERLEQDEPGLVVQPLIGIEATAESILMQLSS